MKRSRAQKRADNAVAALSCDIHRRWLHRSLLTARYELCSRGLDERIVTFQNIYKNKNVLSGIYVIQLLRVHNKYLTFCYIITVLSLKVV